MIVSGRPQRGLNRAWSLYYLTQFNLNHKLKIGLRGEPVMNNIAEKSRKSERTCMISVRTGGAGTSSRLPFAVIVLSMALMVPFISLQGAASASLPTTTVQTIDVQGNASDCHVALDRLGIVHICYYDEDNGSLMYLTNAGGEWSTQTIAGPLLAGPVCAIATDPKGHAHVAYVGRYLNESPDLMYATNEDGSWSNRVIDAGYVSGQTSIAVDGRDNVHISYHTGGSYENDNLRYATNTGGSWSTEIVDTGQSGYYNAIAVGTDGTVHICSQSGIGGLPLKYSTNAGGSWSTQNIEDVVRMGGQCSIAVDVDGHPHILMSTSPSKGQVNLKHAVYAGGSWSTEVIELGGYVTGSSIAIDGRGVVHVCYRAFENNELVYATDANGSWSRQVVDGLGSSSPYASLTVEGNGSAHICYIASDSAGDHLKYAKIVDAQPSKQPSVPANPTNLTARTMNELVELSWSAPADDGGSIITGYMIYRGNDGGSMVSIATVNDTSYVDSAVKDGDTLYYKVVAVNGNGASAPTDTVAAHLASAPEKQTDGGSSPSVPIGIIGIAGLAAAALVAAFLLVRRKR